MTKKIVALPEHFIGIEDVKRLESFGAHLIAHGRAMRWNWNREHGIEMAFEIFCGGPHEQLFLSIKRDRKKDIFYITDAAGKKLDQGKLGYIMAAIDDMARTARDDGPV